MTKIDKTTARVGFIGPGDMGGPMCTAMVRAGFDVTVSDFDKEKVAALTSVGAKGASSPREIAQSCNVIISMVRDNAQTESVCFGKDGLFETVREGREVRQWSDALRSPEAMAHNLVTRIEQAELGWIPNVRLPIRYSGTPLADPRPAPILGEHTREVLAEVLGYDTARLDTLERDSALASAPSAPDVAKPAR